MTTMLRPNSSLKYLLILGWAILVLPAFFSCGKSDTTSPTGSNVRLQILNLSPDSYPVELWVYNGQSPIRLNSSYRFNSTPSYFYFNYTNSPLQLRSTRIAADTPRIFTRDTIQFRADTRYSVFFTGLFADRTLRSIVMADDTASLPPIGKGGKIRFVNCSPRSTPFDIWANGTVAIKDVAFGAVSDYVTLPPGNYSFRAYPVGSTTSSLTTLQNVAIQDGRLYTLYSRGMVGRVDSAAFSLNSIATNPPIK